MEVGRIATIASGSALVGTYIVAGHAEALVAGVALLFANAGPTRWSIKAGPIMVMVHATLPKTSSRRRSLARRDVDARATR